MNDKERELCKGTNWEIDVLRGILVISWWYFIFCLTLSLFIIFP